MNSIRLNFIFIFIKLFLIFLETTSAVHIENFNLFKPKLTFKAETWNIIPCAFHTRRQLDPVKIQLEWGFIPEGREEYKPLVHLFGTHMKTATPDLKDKYKLFIPKVAEGNCSLVIPHTEMKDHGTYQVKLIIKGKEYKPLSSIKVEVVKQLKSKSRSAKSRSITQTTTIPPTTIAEITNTSEKPAVDLIDDTILPNVKGNELKYGIIFISVVSTLALYSVIGIIICIKMSQRKNKGDSGDEENPSSQENSSSSDESSSSLFSESD